MSIPVISSLISVTEKIFEWLMEMFLYSVQNGAPFSLYFMLIVLLEI